MPEKQLVNPQGAYGYAADFGAQTLDCHVGATPVVAGNIVSFDANGNVVPTVANADLKMFGVSLDAGAVGSVVRVQVQGFATLVASAAIAAGVTISGSATSGQAGAASATINGNIGVSVTAAAGGGSSFVAYIAKS